MSSKRVEYIHLWSKSQYVRLLYLREPEFSEVKNFDVVALSSYADAGLVLLSGAAALIAAIVGDKWGIIKVKILAKV